ncbi:MAG: hypothetical protein ACXACX_21885 [Candidatus Hodarchaeales archaeon]|jgi:hypothetical protein
MSKFVENLKHGIKKISNLITKRSIHISILGDSLEFVLTVTTQNQPIKQFLEDLIIKVNDIVVYDATAYPFDYDVKLNNQLYLNKEILEIYDKSLRLGDKLGLIVPNRPNLSAGAHKIIIATHSTGIKASFSKYISLAPEKTDIDTPQIAKKDALLECKYCGKDSSDPNQVICEYCGSELQEI